VSQPASLSTPAASDGRWDRRPVLAAGLRLAILLVPIGLSLAVTAFLRSLLPRPSSTLAWLGWWIALLSAGVAAAVIFERLGRRLMPLVMLLKLSMLFPDQAPSRFAVAVKAGSVRNLRSRLAEGRDHPAAREESLSAATILALATAQQSHDRRTRGHAERVRVFTDMLGQELKLSPEEQDRLRWSALLHDIGKMTVESKVLNKPGRLNEHEWEAIRAHPLEGARIAAPLLQWLGPWGAAIAEHHEWYDGSGYPAGLAGDSISFAGRIVAVADAYDTMTAARSYKKPMAIRPARAELARCAGTQFDPVVVRAFFAISLPKLLWKTGPLSFLVQLPFLARLEQLGEQGLAAAAQGMTVATVVAGAAAITALGAGSSLAHSQTHATPSTQPGVSVATVTPGGGPGGSPSPGSGGGIPSSIPSLPPSPSPTPPVPTPSPSPSPLPSPPIPSLSPLPLPSLSPLPLPSLSPLPMPSLSPLPLPLPTPSISLPGLTEPDESRS
jgi:hypothetical protein